MHVSIVHDCVRGRPVRGCGRALSITVVSDMPFIAVPRLQPVPPRILLPLDLVLRFHGSVQCGIIGQGLSDMLFRSC